MTNIVKNTTVETRTEAKKITFPGLSREGKLLTKIVACLMLAVFVVIGLHAYTATLQYENNTLADENEFLQAEIDSLESQIIEETKVTSIEKTAMEKYGMVYPTADNYIVIKEDKEVSNNNLATTIKKRAYN